MNKAGAQPTHAFAQSPTHLNNELDTFLLEAVRECVEVVHGQGYAKVGLSQGGQA